MFIYQVEKSSVVSFGAGEVDSKDPSAFINIANAWAKAGPDRRVIVQAQRARLPYGKIARLDLLKVSGDSVEVKTEAEISVTEQSKEAEKATEKQNRKKIKDDFFDLINVPPPKRAEAARALKVILEDGNAD